MRQQSYSKCGLGWLLYAFSFVLLFFCTFYSSTTFVAFGDINFFLNISRAISVCMVALKCILVDKYNIKRFLLMLMLLMLGGITWIASRRGAFLDVIVLMVGAANIKPKQIVKLYTVCASVFLAVAFVCSISGIIVDYTTYRVMNMIQIGTRERHSFGINYPTDFAAHVFFIYISYYYLRYGKRKIKLLDYVIAAAIIVFLDFYCDARFSEVLIGLSLVLFTLADYKPRLFDKKLIKTAVLWVFPLSAIFTIGVTTLYKSSSALWILIDQMLFSKRLSIGSRMLSKHGISLFGQEILMQGLGFKVSGYDTSIGTTYLDSSYMQLYLLYGLFATVFIIVISMMCCHKVNQENDTIMKCIVLLLAISCILNQYLLIISYNPFIIVFGAYVLSKRKKLVSRR